MHTAAIILGLIGVLLPFLLVGLRRYALRPAATARWKQTPPAPLTGGALCQLAAWQRHNLLLFAAFVILVLGGGLINWTGLAKNGIGLMVFAGLLLVGQGSCSLACLVWPTIFRRNARVAACASACRTAWCCRAPVSGAGSPCGRIAEHSLSH